MSRIVQIAMAGNPTTGSSLRAGMVSSVMQRRRTGMIRDDYLIVDGGKLAGVGAHSYTARGIAGIWVADCSQTSPIPIAQTLKLGGPVAVSNEFPAHTPPPDR